MWVSHISRMKSGAGTQLDNRDTERKCSFLLRKLYHREKKKVNDGQQSADFEGRVEAQSYHNSSPRERVERKKKSLRPIMFKHPKG